MREEMRKQIRRLLLLTAALTLAGCGGGGGSGGDAAVASLPASAAIPTPVAASSPTASTTTSTASTPSTVQPTYAAGSPELAAFNYLNAERERCGFGTLKQNAKLDVAAAGQANYETLRWNEGTGHEYVTLKPHVQTAGLSGFTGATIHDRAVTAAGYRATGYLSENSNQYNLASLSANDVDRATSLLSGLLNTVYHLDGLTRVNNDVGFGYGVAADAPTSFRNSPTATLVVLNGQEIGSTLKAQAISLLTYPCEGTTALAKWSQPESPNPFASGFAGGTWRQPVGTPIYLRSPTGTQLVVQSATVDGYTAETMVMTAANDPNARLGGNQAFLLLRSPLEVDRSYTVRLAVTVDGAPALRVFTFQTK